jgi:hypothetical protein
VVVWEVAAVSVLDGDGGEFTHGGHDRVWGAPRLRAQSAFGRGRQLLAKGRHTGPLKEWPVPTAGEEG